jgi:hypothetical protein
VISVRYVDSRSRDAKDTLYAWLAEHLPDAIHFAAQTGYFRFNALDPFLEDILRILQTGGRFDLVIGANEDRLSAEDLDALLDLVGSYVPAQASLTLVGSRDGLFHPKSYFVETKTNRHALVGSGNLTHPGSGHNIEAFLEVDDGDAPSIPDSIRQAIVAWRDEATKTGIARPLTRRLIQEFLAHRAIDPVALSDLESPKRGPSDRAEFPSLPKIKGLAARRRSPGRSGSLRRLRGAQKAFPPGKIGVVKRLSATDVKGFAGRRGTIHLSLGARDAPVARCLPMEAYGSNGEPRVDLAVEARLDQALEDVVTSGTDSTNITHVGVGLRQNSNPDLRFNLLHRVIDGLGATASRHGIDVPKPGDAAAIELTESGRLARVTFATTDPLRSDLLAQVQAGRAWGWLDSHGLPRW